MENTFCNLHQFYGTHQKCKQNIYKLLQFIWYSKVKKSSYYLKIQCSSTTDKYVSEFYSNATLQNTHVVLLLLYMVMLGVSQVEEKWLIEIVSYRDTFSDNMHDIVSWG